MLLGTALMWIQKRWHTQIAELALNKGHLHQQSPITKLPETKIRPVIQSS